MFSGKNIFLSGVLAAVLMTGCGDSTPPPANEKSALLKGVAVDDLIVNGKVKVYDPAKPSEILATGRTDKNDGSYRLKVSYDGVVVVQVSCDEKSQMKNPATGELKSCKEDLKLHSAAALSPEKKEVVVNISPVSEFVVRQMEAKGATKESLEEAQSNIGDMFGFDPLATNPVENIQYKKVIAAVHKLAEQENEDDIVDVVEKLADDLADGEAGDDSNLTQKFAQIMESEGVANKLTENDGKYKPEPSDGKSGTSDKKDNTQKPDSGDSGSSGKSDDSGKTTPSPDPEKQKAENIALAKKFIKEIRTQTLQVVDYQNYGGGFLNYEADALGTSLEGVTLNVKAAGKYVARITGDIAKAIATGETEYRSYTDSGKEFAYQKESDSVWKYEIFEENTPKYSGTVTLSQKDPQSIGVLDFSGTLQVKFEGAVPVEDDYLDSGGASSDTAPLPPTSPAQSMPQSRAVAQDGQTLTAEISLSKKKYGAELVLDNVSLSYDGDTATMDNVVLQAYYDQENDDLNMNRVFFNSASVALHTNGYDINGTLLVPEYRQNNGMKDKTFFTDNYTTYISGNVACLGEHNERVERVSSGKVIYTDKSGIKHTIPISEWGGFYTEIEGNIDQLDWEGGYASSATPQMGDTYWGNYKGLVFDDLNITSTSCDKVILEEFKVNVFDDKNITRIDGVASCLKGDDLIPFDTMNVRYRDKNGIVHEHNVTSGYSDPTQFFSFDESGTDLFENFYNKGRATFKGKETADSYVVDFDRIGTSGAYCKNPVLMYLSIATVKISDNKYKTQIDGHARCYDDNTTEILDQDEVIVYTDKTGQKHEIKQYGGDFRTEIDGNPEQLPLSYGEYSAAGFVHTVTNSNIDIQVNACPNPVLTWVALELDKDRSFTNSGYLPKKVVFDGMIADKDNNSSLTGNVVVDWLNAETMDLTSKTAKPKVEVTVSGKLEMPKRPSMLLNLGYTNNDSKNNFSLGYQYDQTVVNGTGIFDEEMDNGKVVLHTHEGLQFVVKVKDGKVVYGDESSITRNGAPVGVLEDRDGVPVIKYTDNSFESLQ